MPDLPSDMFIPIKRVLMAATVVAGDGPLSGDCKVCGKKIETQIFKYTGSCSINCEKAQVRRENEKLSDPLDRNDA